MDTTPHFVQTQRTGRYFSKGADSPKRVWIVLHGYGQLAEFFLKNFDLAAENGDLIIAPEGLSRFYLSGVYGRVGASWMTKEDRLHEIEDYIHFLDNVLENALSSISGNPEIVVLGFSQGTATALRWLKARPQKLAHLVIWAGDIPQDTAASLPDLVGDAKVWLRIGDQDEFITPEIAAKRHAALREAIPDLNFRQFAGTHRIPKDAFAELWEAMHA